MAFKFSRSGEVKLKASDHSTDKAKVWGLIQETDLAILGEVSESQKAWTGSAVAGINKRYYNDNEGSYQFEIAEGHELVSGEILVERATKGPTYMRGKLPKHETDIGVLCNNLIAGTKYIGESEITAVKPKLNVASKYSK